MRLPRPRFCISQMMVAVAVLGIGIALVARYPRGWTYYARGWWDAECELWQDSATIYECGGHRDLFTDSCRIDRKTGLPLNSLSGCVRSEGESERVQGHNDRIAQHIRWHGLPKNTFKAWEYELFFLKRFFDDRSRTNALQRLVPGGLAFSSPDGRNTVRPVTGDKNDRTHHSSLKVIIAAESVVLDEWYVRFDVGDSDLLWGLEGSRFVVIRSTSDKTEHYRAFNLRTGRFLREETWIEGRLRDAIREQLEKCLVDPYDN
jgi:hypothetical protein